MSDFKRNRLARQKNFDIYEKELVPFKFDGKDKEVYKNCNLSIFVDDYCNADCKFCVAQLRYENRNKLYEKERIEDDDAYYERLDEVLEKLEPLNLSVSITGGEPTKSPRLPRILELLEKHHIRKRTITTNGSGLFDKVNGKTMLDHLIDNHFNISKTHYDEDINKKIMCYKQGYCSNEDLAKIIPYALKKGLRPRLSCLLLKDGIHDVEGMAKYIEFYEKIGVDNIIFRQLMDYDLEKMCNVEKMHYCMKNEVDLNDIWEEVDKDKRFIPFKNILGYYYYVEIYNYNKVVVCSESADLKVLYEEKKRHPDVVYELVFHPNGNLNGSWVDNEDILMEYKND